MRYYRRGEIFLVSPVVVDSQFSFPTLFQSRLPEIVLTKEDFPDLVSPTNIRFISSLLTVFSETTTQNKIFLADFHSLKLAFWRNPPPPPPTPHPSIYT